jgi:hypothetical protein
VAGELVDHELLRELAEQRRYLLQRRLAPAPAAQIDGEVDPVGKPLRVADAKADRALHGELLEVGAADVKQERQLAVVDRQLCDRGVERAEPERRAGTLAYETTPAVAQDVGGGLGPEVDRWRSRPVLASEIFGLYDYYYRTRGIEPLVISTKM